MPVHLETRMSVHDTTPDASVAAPVFKIATAWAAVGITSWADFASVLACIYTALLIFEWCWKKIGRPTLERHGWIKPNKD